MRDTHSDMGLAQAIAPAVLAATTTSAALDLQGFNSATVTINCGAIVSAGNFTAKLQESDTTTSGDFTDVAGADLIGTLPAVLAENSVYKQGYKGAKRYVRVVMTKNSGTSLAVSAMLIRGHASVGPVA